MMRVYPLGPLPDQSQGRASWGMGKVCQTRDIRLDRTVAIKVLSEPVAS